MGCHECEGLQERFDSVVEENAEILRKFQAAVLNHDQPAIDYFRLLLLDVEERRRETRVEMLSHRETHTQRRWAGG
jgi:hypothetical protein